jgi:PAS domain S-box-containing protein
MRSQPASPVALGLAATFLDVDDAATAGRARMSYRLRLRGNPATTNDRRRRRAEDLASVTGALAIVVGGAALAGLHFGGGSFEAVIQGLLVLYGVLASVIWLAARHARLTENSRQAALEELDTFFDVSNDLLATASAEGYFVRLNPAWTATLGYDLDELCSRPFIDFVHPDDVEATKLESERQIAAGESVVNFQNRYRHADGSYRWLEWSSTPSADRTWFYAVARDVTERKLEEERLAAPALALARRQAEERERIQGIIDTRSFTPVFQPIIDLSTGETIGFEALTLFADGSPSNENFAAAIECGLGRALERATLVAALEESRDLPRRTWLSVNISPAYLADADALQTALGIRVRPLVLEVTEHEVIDAYGPLRDAVSALGLDIRLAVDDAGAGIANFTHLVELRPHIVKVDASLVRGVDKDVGRQAVVAGLVHFATAADCLVIAEGIETDAELSTLIGLRVSLGQGFLLGRPAPAATWPDGRQVAFDIPRAARRRTGALG